MVSFASICPIPLNEDKLQKIKTGMNSLTMDLSHPNVYAYKVYQLEMATAIYRHGQLQYLRQSQVKKMKSQVVVYVKLIDITQEH